MTVRMNGTLRHCLAGSALSGLIVLTAVPAAMAQWLPPWRTPPGVIEQRLEAQGYMLIAPLQRRPQIYLADVSAGPAGYQRLVIDAWSGDILQRFVVPARRWGPQLAERGGEFAVPPPGFVEPGPSGGFSTTPDGGPAARSAYGGPPNVRIPAAISPVGSPDAPSATKPKPKSAPTGHNVPETKPATTAAPPVEPGKPQGAGADAARNNPGAAAPAAAVPLPPPKPTENQDSDKPRADSPPTEVENAPPAAPERASAAAPPDLKPEAAPKTEPSATAQSEGAAPQPSATRRSEGPAPQPTARDSSTESSEKSKVSIVPATLFE
jgi:hypothetical protein